MLRELGVEPDFEKAIAQELEGKKRVVTASYRGNLPKFLETFAEGIGCDVEVEDDKGKTKKLKGEELKKEIMLNVNESTVLIIPNCNLLSRCSSVVFWLEDLVNDRGLTIIGTSPIPLQKGVFMSMTEVELKNPSDRHIREVMESEARKLGLSINSARLSELQGLAGKNAALAKKLILQEYIGVKPENPEHSNYLDISPIVISGLMTLGIVRFIGMGTGNKSLYIIGGVALILGMMLKQLGSLKGAKKKRGQ